MAVGNQYKKGDRFLWPYHESQGNKIVIKESGLSHTLTLTGGDNGLLYARSGHRFNDEFNGLYKVLVDEMNDHPSTNNTYALTLTDGSKPDNTLYDRAMKLTRTSGAASWSLDMSNAAWTLDKRLLGFREGHAVDESGGASLTSPLGVWGIWQPPVVAHNKRRVRKKTSFAYGTTLNSKGVWTSMARWDVRQFLYRFVPPAHLFTKRAFTANTATSQGLVQYDDHNAFEWLWRSADLGPILFLPDKNFDWGNSDTFLNDPHEALQWVDQKSLEEFGQSFKRIENASGELYDIEFELAITEHSTTEWYEH